MRDCAPARFAECQNEASCQARIPDFCCAANSLIACSAADGSPDDVFLDVPDGMLSEILANLADNARLHIPVERFAQVGHFPGRATITSEAMSPDAMPIRRFDSAPTGGMGR